MLQSSVEYVVVTITGPSAATVDTDVVMVGFALDGAGLPAQFYQAAHAGAGLVQILVGPGTTVGQLALGTNRVYVKVTDNPEAPVLNAGVVMVTAD